MQKEQKKIKENIQKFVQRIVILALLKYTNQYALFYVPMQDFMQHQRGGNTTTAM